MHTAKAATAGLVVRLGAHRWAIPTAGLLTLLGSLIMGVWSSVLRPKTEVFEELGEVHVSPRCSVARVDG